MTDTEILDWLEREQPRLLSPAGEFPHWFVLDRDGENSEAPTLREAVEKAARENGDD